MLISRLLLISLLLCSTLVGAEQEAENNQNLNLSGDLDPVIQSTGKKSDGETDSGAEAQIVEGQAPETRGVASDAGQETAPKIDEPASLSQKPEDSSPKTQVEQHSTPQRQVLSARDQIDKTIDQLIDLSRQKFSVVEEDIINQILEQQEQAIGALLKFLRQSESTRLQSRVDKKRLSFLKSRVEINQERGNILAVERDQIEQGYHLVLEQMIDYLEYLMIASRTYKTVDEVVDYTLKILTQVKQDADQIVLPASSTDSAIYLELEKNYHQYQSINGMFQGVLEYVTNNPGEIVKSYWFQKFTLVSVISSINNLDFIKPVNYKLAPFNIDVGGFLVSLSIIVLIIFCYPLFIKFSAWFIDKVILHQALDHSTLIIHELRRPLKFLLLFFSIDMATYALLYKTAYKPSLDKIEFVVYAFITVWLLYKLLDTFLIIQFEKIARRRKDLRKEIINLGIQFVKGILFIVALSFVLNRFGISITAIVSTLGIGGLAFALAAKDTLSNLFGGITILIDNVFRMGDWVTIGGDEGTVAEIGLRSTTLRTFDNALITIPNSVVSVSSVKNWNRRTVGRRIKMHIGVTYECKRDDLRRALDDIRTMLREHPDISNPKETYGSKPVRFRLSSREDTQGIKSTQLVFLDRYGEFSIDIMIYCFSKTVAWAEWLKVKEDVLFKISEILEKNHLEFAYPTEVRINRTAPANLKTDLLLND